MFLSSYWQPLLLSFMSLKCVSVKKNIDSKPFSFRCFPDRIESLHLLFV